MRIEDQLRDRLKKVEALYFGAATAGERDAAEAAAERLKAKLEEVSRRDPPIEMKFSLPDQWSVRLFIALCRRYGIGPFRYPRQRATTIMVRAPRRPRPRSTGGLAHRATRLPGPSNEARFVHAALATALRRSGH